MKSFIVLILVAAAAGGLFFVLGKDKGTPSSVETSNVERDAPDAQPAETPVQDDPLRRVDNGSGRSEANIPTMATEANTDLSSPSAMLAGAGEVTGAATNEAGDPVVGAEVLLTLYGAQSLNFLMGDQDRSSDIKGRTGSDGTFLFTNVAAKEGYSVVLTHESYSRIELGGLLVQDGKSTDAGVIVMKPGRALRGRVTDSGGNAVPEAKLVLTANSFATPFGDEGSEEAITVVADISGKYEFTNVAPMQNYALTVTAEGYGISSRSPIAVVEKEDTVVDVVLEVASMLAGLVKSSNGEPVEGAVIEAWMSGDSQRSVTTNTRSNELGEFEFTDVPPGSFQLVARHPAYMPVTGQAADSGDVSVSITMDPKPMVRGRVVDQSTGAPVTRFTVQLRVGISGSINGQTQGLDKTLVEVEDPNGEFAILAPKSGMYLVEAIANGFADTYSDQFESAVGQDVSGIMVQMTRGGTIFGRVVDKGGRPVQGAVVESHDEVWSDDAFWAIIGDVGDGTDKAVTTAADGTFRLTALKPANYQLVVRHKDFAQASVKDELSLQEGQELRVPDIKLPKGAKITGTVFGPSGSPMAGAQVKLFPQTPDGKPHAVQTDKQGTFTISAVRAGSYKIHAERPPATSDNPFGPSIDMKATQRAITVTEGQTVTGEEFRLSDR